MNVLEVAVITTSALAKIVLVFLLADVRPEIVHHHRRPRSSVRAEPDVVTSKALVDIGVRTSDLADTAIGLL